jgi:CheY-like chemotaxis protein
LLLRTSCSSVCWRTRCLRTPAYRVIEARDGQEALAILGLQPNIGLLLTNVLMPSLDGYSLSKIAAERWPDLRIILTSALPPPGELQDQGGFCPPVIRAMSPVPAIARCSTILREFTPAGSGPAGEQRAHVVASR